MRFYYSIPRTQALRDEAYFRMRAEGLLPCAMSAVARPTLELWRSITAPENGHLVRCALEDGSFAACALLTPFRGRLWEFDFTTFRATARHAVPLAHGLFRWAFAQLDCAGLIGFCPRSNRHAWQLAEACGFQVLGRLPQAAWLARRGQHEDAVLVLVTPESLHAACTQETAAKAAAL